jgi:hypothetical protein
VGEFWLHLDPRNNALDEDSPVRAIKVLPDPMSGDSGTRIAR